MKKERYCCDGKCAQGRGVCPAFAPGVIDGPHRRTGIVARWLGAAWALLSALWSRP